MIRLPKQKSYIGPRALRSQTTTASPPAPHRAATRPAERENSTARTTRTTTPTAATIGARGSLKKAAALLRPARAGRAATGSFRAGSAGRAGGLAVIGSGLGTPIQPATLHKLH